MTVTCKSKHQKKICDFRTEKYVDEPHLPVGGEPVIRLTDALDELAELVSPLFARPEPRLQALQYVTGLLRRGRRKNSWRIAEIAGDMSPWRTQRLLNRARWDADAVRDAVRGYLAVHLGHPDGVLVLGEIGVIKKGAKSVAVARQYTETTRRVENCQVGMFASYVSSRGRAIVDHELYLPKSWTDDPARCWKAGVPRDRMEPHTKPELARNMIQRFWAADFPVGWVTGGVDYGRSQLLRTWLESQRISYVLTVPPSQPVVTQFARKVPASSLSTGIASHGWHQYPEGVEPTTGPSISRRRPRRKARADSDWARIDVTRRGNDGARAYGPALGFAQTLLMQRRPDSPRLVFYLAHAPTFSSIHTLAAVAQAQLSARDCLRMAQEQASMDEYEVRNWTAWHRHIALAELALAALVVSRPDSGICQAQV